MPREIPDELVERARGEAGLWVAEHVTPGSQHLAYSLASSMVPEVLSRISEAGWVRAEELDESEREWPAYAVTLNRRLDEARAQAKALAQALEFMDTHYSGSLDFRPPYVKAGRDALRAFRESQEADHAA